MSWEDESDDSSPSTYDEQIDDMRPSIASLESNKHFFIEENGRTYHKYKSGKQDRLDMQHQLFCYTIGGLLTLCPLPRKLRRVLDIATGTGIWAIEFACQYPDAEIFGFDLSPIQPSNVPENCTFGVKDAEEDWGYTEPFTFIHGRALATCFEDPGSVIRRAYDNLEPGGYIEFQDGLFPFEWVGEPPRETALYRWNVLMVEGARRLGRSWSNVANYPRYFKEAGFEDIVQRRFYWPVSPWAKGEYFQTLAMYFQHDMIAGLEGLSMRVLKALGMTSDEISEFVEEVKEDFKNPELHAYVVITFIYGRKPVWITKS
ncbi:S-adenosyl-L-methionine-dependent methyltransferase [Xylaria nigripes]|nr:S-adenosyl-L-methionine-dependent methyltransferase [Xylaria nigripes]